MVAARVDRRLAAILAADVVGYSRLIEQDEAGTVERLKQHRKTFIEPLIAEHQGRIARGGAAAGAPVRRQGLARRAAAREHGRRRQERLADGMADDLIAELGRYRNIAVIAKSSSFTYKGKAVDVRQVGRELGVRYVLEGDLETDPKRVRVAVQLIDTGTGAQI
jgi:class 3 adenylate cyclase